jgi:hypothetical protein
MVIPTKRHALWARFFWRCVLSIVNVVRCVTEENQARLIMVPQWYDESPDESWLKPLIMIAIPVTICWSLGGLFIYFKYVLYGHSTVSASLDELFRVRMTARSVSSESFLHILQTIRITIFVPLPLPSMQRPFLIHPIRRRLPTNHQ